MFFSAQCGASLASAKGRRKHEKKHCPNTPRSLLLLPHRPSLGHHSLLSRVVRVPLKQQKRFECRLCGKVLKTYEGRRLHEKLQHQKPVSAYSVKSEQMGGEMLGTEGVERGGQHLITKRLQVRIDSKLCSKTFFLCILADFTGI